MKALILGLALAAACGTGRPAEAVSTGCAGGAVRLPAVAGSFYPADSLTLAVMVDSLLDCAPCPSFRGAVIAGIVPHAGYVFSAATAACFYATIRGRSFDTVVLIGPAHTMAFQGFSVFGGDAWETPLGRVPVDTAMARRILQGHPSAICCDAAHAQEHSLEVQLPFLQRSLEPGFSILPVLVCSADADELAYMAELILAEACGKRVLVIASSDLSHYPDLETASRTDSATVAWIRTGDVEGFLSATIPSRTPPGVETFLCGRLPVAVLMTYAGLYPGMQPMVLGMTTSAEASGDSTRVVGYAAVGFMSEETSPSEWEISQDGCARLLSIASESAGAAVLGEAYSLPSNLEGELELPRGAFVTIREGGELRGCIGLVRPVLPVAEAVAMMGRSAALEDPRFPPILPEELPMLEFEVSVLTPLQILEDWREVRIGTDGLMIVDAGGASGLLLPQVAVEQGWDRDRFLEGVCAKAGLPADAYLGDAVLYRFQAQVFGDEPGGQGI
jgi:MEMO1 family protein